MLMCEVCIIELWILFSDESTPSSLFVVRCRFMTYSIEFLTTLFSLIASSQLFVAHHTFLSLQKHGRNHILHFAF